MEAVIVIPTKIGMPTAKTVVQGQRDNDEELLRHMEWIDEIRGNTTIRMLLTIRERSLITTKRHNHDFSEQEP